MKAKKRILVLGSDGHIGSAIRRSDYFKSKNLKIVILGHEGQLGTELFKSLSLKYKTFGISKNYSTKSDNYLGNLYFTKKLFYSAIFLL